MVNENLALGELPEILRDENYQEPEFKPDDELSDSNLDNSQSAESAGEVANQENSSQQEDNSSPKVWTINRENFSEEFEKYFREDSDFAREISSRIGNKARERYFPQIEERDREIAYLKAQLAKQEYSKIPENELSEKLRNNSDFRKQYDAVQEASNKAPEQVQLNPAQATLNVFLEEAAEQGFTREDAEKLQEYISSGKYEKDEFGNPFTSASEWPSALKLMKRDIDALVAARKAANNTSQQTQTEPNSNTQTQEQIQPSPQLQHRDSSGPDISNPGNRGGRSIYTYDEVRRMPIEQRLKLWPTEEDQERAIASGEIKLSDDLRI